MCNACTMGGPSGGAYLQVPPPQAQAGPGGAGARPAGRRRRPLPQHHPGAGGARRRVALVRGLERRSPQPPSRKRWQRRSPSGWELHQGWKCALGPGMHYIYGAFRGLRRANCWLAMPHAYNACTCLGFCRLVRLYTRPAVHQAAIIPAIGLREQHMFACLTKSRYMHYRPMSRPEPGEILQRSKSRSPSLSIARFAPIYMRSLSIT